MTEKKIVWKSLGVKEYCRYGKGEKEKRKRRSTEERERPIKIKGVSEMITVTKNSRKRGSTKRQCYLTRTSNKVRRSDVRDH